MIDKIVAEGEIQYSKKEKVFKLGVGLPWSQTPSLSIADIQRFADEFPSLSSDYYEFKSYVETSLTEIFDRLNNSEVGNASTLEGHPASYFATAEHRHNLTDINNLLVDDKISLDLLPSILSSIIDKFDERGLLKERFLPEIIDCNNEFEYE